MAGRCLLVWLWSPWLGLASPSGCWSTRACPGFSGGPPCSLRIPLTCTSACSSQGCSRWGLGVLLLLPCKRSCAHFILSSQGPGRAGAAREAGGPHSCLFSLFSWREAISSQKSGGSESPTRGMAGMGRAGHVGYTLTGGQWPWHWGPGMAPHSCAGYVRKEASGDRKGAFPSPWVSL